MRDVDEDQHRRERRVHHGGQHRAHADQGIRVGRQVFRHAQALEDQSQCAAEHGADEQRGCDNPARAAAAQCQARADDFRDAQEQQDQGEQAPGHLLIKLRAEHGLHGAVPVAEERGHGVLLEGDEFHATDDGPGEGDVTDADGAEHRAAERGADPARERFQASEELFGAVHEQRRCRTG